MTITIDGIAGNGSNIETWIASAQVGANMYAPPAGELNLDETSTAYPGYAFLTQSVTMDDTAFLASNDYVSFVGAGSSGIFMSSISSFASNAGLRADDFYIVNGMRLSGSPTTLTSFKMGSWYYEDPPALGS